MRDALYASIYLYRRVMAVSSSSRSLLTDDISESAVYGYRDPRLPVFRLFAPSIVSAEHLDRVYCPRLSVFRVSA
ncbi:hypothetical protein L596_002496 [Steinernema carpocapsae]|uniref:Uncharacterized protein n=1 Tax=Steinernema carpocapsae TaxID=34508 RepID=A0A4U8UPY0_STECR|nr:hypothetical protein L596_002496 [Steinernema carpocapsae]